MLVTTEAANNNPPQPSMKNPVCVQPQLLDKSQLNNQDECEVLSVMEPASSRGAKLVNNHKEIRLLKGKLLARDLRIKSLKADLVPFRGPKHKQLLTDDKSCQFYTAIPKLSVFYLICQYISTVMNQKQRLASSQCGKFSSSRGKTHSGFLVKKRTHHRSRLPHEDCILMTLMKLRLDLLHRDLAERFCISAKDVTYTLHHYIAIMAKSLKPILLKFYPRSEIAKTLPKEYLHYKRLRCIIDCSEIFIQKPSDLKLQAATWSDYKHHNTLKFLIAITPQGSICFVSKLWGRRTSNKTYSKC